jgi:hypothetical protein
VNARIEYLSLAALRMAAGGISEVPAVVAHWLYRFGTVPRGPAVDRDFGPDDDPMAVLGLTARGAVRRRLEAVYEATSLSGWFSFVHTTAVTPLSPVCKLYVSPRPEALADAFPHIADAFVRSDVRSFKVGRRIEGLLRPDKIIAYFDDRAHLEAVAGVLARSLAGCPVQGVPFTTDAGGNGLLSSGVDPPPRHATSWRAWVTNRLAASLIAHRATAPSDRVAAALAEIRLAGVDPELWLPSADAFGDVSAS